MSSDQQLELSPEASLPTAHGTMLVRYAQGFGKSGIIARYDVPFSNPVPIRIQSSCVFSESLGTVDCDCSDQLKRSLQIIADKGGYLVYLYEEGRGAGLAQKIRAINLQVEQGVDTVEAFRQLGMPADLRDYRLASQVLLTLIGNREISLLTNDPNKILAMRQAGVHVVGSSRLVVAKNDLVRSYLYEKAQVLGHDIESS